VNLSAAIECLGHVVALSMGVILWAGALAAIRRAARGGERTPDNKR